MCWFMVIAFCNLWALELYFSFRAYEDKLLSPSGVKSPGLPSNWFWQAGSVDSLINSEDCYSV